MQSPSSPDRLYVRLSDELAALLGREEVFEDELLDTLRERGHMTYPSPLLAPLLESLPEVFEEEILKQRLDPTDRAMFARVSRGCKAAVVASGLAIAGATEEEPFEVAHFVGSVELLALAKGTGCPWDEDTCGRIAAGGHLEVLRWARAEHCPWDEMKVVHAPLRMGTWRC